jgi:hypothetical protein
LVSRLERDGRLKMRSNNHTKAIASTNRSSGSIHLMRTSLSAMMTARMLPKRDLLCLPRDTVGKMYGLSLIHEKLRYRESSICGNRQSSSC